jgi:hypothetical protein
MDGMDSKNVAAVVAADENGIAHTLHLEVADNASPAHTAPVEWGSLRQDDGRSLSRYERQWLIREAFLKHLIRQTKVGLPRKAVMSAFSMEFNVSAKVAREAIQRFLMNSEFEETVVLIENLSDDGTTVGKPRKAKHIVSTIVRSEVTP